MPLRPGSAYSPVIITFWICEALLSIEIEYAFGSVPCSVRRFEMYRPCSEVLDRTAEHGRRGCDRTGVGWQLALAAAAAEPCEDEPCHDGMREACRGDARRDELRAERPIAGGAAWLHGRER